VIGLNPSRTIDTTGVTKLVEVGGNFVMETGATNVGLSFQGALLSESQLTSNWFPVAAEQTSTGYDFAWKGDPGYMVWSLDGNGVYTGNIVGPEAGTSYAFESLESTFPPRRTADLVTGLNPSRTIETTGATKLVEVGGNFVLQTGSTNVAL